jgi:nucleoid-associated protein YgaU
MHSIERYGIVALLFLVVTVVAVLMWDGGKEKKQDGAGATAAPATAARPERTRPARDDARRLSLVAEPQPGPLARQPRTRDAGAAGTEGEAPPEGGALAPERALDAPGVQQATAPTLETAMPPPQTRREEPARDPIVGRAPSGPTHAYAVRDGDTLSEIAQRELGSARRWPEIVAANPGLDPARLRVGKSIQVPGEARAPAAQAAAKDGRAESGATRAATSPRTWKVGKGESLWKIAERALGDGVRWREIAALNPRVNPDRLELGQVLTLPEAGSAPAKQAAPTARRESDRAPLVASRGDESSSQGRRKVR